MRMLSKSEKQSVWYSTPEKKRRRKSIELTLSPEALDRLGRMARARKGASRSAVVEEIVMAAPVRPARKKEA